MHVIPSAGEATYGHVETPSILSFTSSPMEAFLEVIPDAVILVDLEGVIVDVNGHAEQMFGYSKVELLGQPVELLVPEAYRINHTVLREAFSQQPDARSMSAEMEVSGRARDGLEFPVDIKLNPLYNMGVPYIIASVRDLSRRLNERRRVERARNEVQHRLLDGEELERQRLAQALHDGPLQELHSLDFELVALARQIEDHVYHSHLLELRASLRQVARHVRNVCQDLRPPALTPFGVSAVIRSYADTFQAENPTLQVVLELEEDDQRLPERVRLTLYRICQHALRNVAQHANATGVAVSLQIRSDEVELGIVDNGVGFALPSEWLEFIHQGKFGLLGCVERMEAINGKIEIQSAPGKGSEVRVRAPILAATPGD